VVLIAYKLDVLIFPFTSKSYVKEGILFIPTQFVVLSMKSVLFTTIVEGVARIWLVDVKKFGWPCRNRLRSLDE